MPYGENTAAAPLFTGTLCSAVDIFDYLQRRHSRSRRVYLTSIVALRPISQSYSSRHREYTGWVKNSKLLILTKYQ